MKNTIRDLTHSLHEELESTPFAKAMFEGKLDDCARKDYLASQRVIFRYLDEHVPEELHRTPAFDQDIKTLAGAPPTPCIASHVYHSHLTQRAKMLGPHIYVNYMGLLFGGQIMKKNYPTTIYDFDTPINDLRTLIRNDYVETTPSYVSEAKIAFENQIKIFTELGRIHHVG